MSEGDTNPGDEAAPGTACTGERGGKPCRVHGGTGRVTEEIGGG
jgi:hypothetical protein